MEPIVLPYHLFRSYHALQAIGGRGSAGKVCERSGNKRSIDSQRLNILVMLGVCKKVKNPNNHREFEFLLLEEVPIVVNKKRTGTFTGDSPAGEVTVEEAFKR